MKPWLRQLAVIAALLVMVPAAAVFAQKKNEDAGVRSVQGTVSSASGMPVGGAVVQLKNIKSLQIRSFITTEQGEYFFNGLSSSVEYQLSAMHDGASSPTKTLSVFDSKKQAILNLKLEK